MVKRIRSTDFTECFFLLGAGIGKGLAKGRKRVKVKMGYTPSRVPSGEPKDNQSRPGPVRSSVVGDVVISYSRGVKSD